MGIPKYSPYFGLLILAVCFIQFRVAEINNVTMNKHNIAVVGHSYICQVTFITKGSQTTP